MQDVSFRSIEELLDFLPENELLITEQLRALVFECIPPISEKLAYNVPFFKLKKNVCFIWPGSIPWGKTTFRGVQFGFTQGHLLTDETSYLDSGKRKFVRTRTFESLNEDDIDMLRMFLYEAAELQSDRQY